MQVSCWSIHVCLTQIKVKFSTAVLWNKIGCLQGRVWTPNVAYLTSMSQSAPWPALKTESVTLFMWTAGRIASLEKADLFRRLSFICWAEQLQDFAPKVRWHYFWQLGKIWRRQSKLWQQRDNSQAFIFTSEMLQERKEQGLSVPHCLQGGSQVGLYRGKSRTRLQCETVFGTPSIPGCKRVSRMWGVLFRCKLWIFSLQWFPPLKPWRKKLLQRVRHERWLSSSLWSRRGM